MRAGVVAVLAGLLAVLAAGCAGEPRPPVVAASEVTPSASASPSVDPDEARLAELRKTDQFDEFAEHERAAKADGARLAWENFAPIVDGKRVEWSNKAELWDSIAPKIRDEALLLGPEYRKPLWNARNAIPNGVSMVWNNEDTEGRGDYAEFTVTYLSARGAVERSWAVLVIRDTAGAGTLVDVMPAIDVVEADHADAAAATEWLRERAWAWVFEERSDDA